MQLVIFGGDIIAVAARNGEYIVRRRRNFVLRKGFCFASTVADNDFDTELLEEISAQTPCFDTNFSPPHSHVKVAEADIEAWRETASPSSHEKRKV
jgi:hypothetical protein